MLPLYGLERLVGVVLSLGDVESGVSGQTFIRFRARHNDNPSKFVHTVHHHGRSQPFLLSLPAKILYKP